MQLALVHDVELHALASGEAHRAVGQLGQAIERQPLLGRELAAGHRRPDHARVVERQLLRRPLAADVAVVLLVDPVELQQHLVVAVEAVAAAGEVLGQGAAQEPALALDVLDAHDDRDGRCRLGHVDAALGLAGTGPAAAADVLARCDRTGARPAADRGVALRRERVLGQQLHRLVVLDVLVGPRGDGVDLHDVAQQVAVDDGRARTGLGVGPPQAAHPRGLAGERPLHRLDLAHRAAAVGVGLPQVLDGARLGADDPQVEAELLAQVLGVPCGLGEQVAGVQEHDVGVRDRLADQVHEHRVTEAGRHDQAVTELPVRPSEDLERMSILEHPAQSTKSRADLSTLSPIRP